MDPVLEPMNAEILKDRSDVLLLRQRHGIEDT
jgi:hypothetical protein